MTVRLLKYFLYAATIVTVVAGLIGLISVLGSAMGGGAATTTLSLRIDPAASTVVRDQAGASVGTLLLDHGTLNVRSGDMAYSVLQAMDILLTCGLWVVLLMLMARLVGQIGGGQPFNAGAVRRLRLVGGLLIGLNCWIWLREIALPPVLLSSLDPVAGDYRLMPAIAEGISGLRNARVDGQLGFGLFAAGAFALLLSEAFRIGAALRDENESIL